MFKKTIIIEIGFCWIIGSKVFAELCKWYSTSVTSPDTPSSLDWNKKCHWAQQVLSLAKSKHLGTDNTHTHTNTHLIKVKFHNLNFLVVRSQKEWWLYCFPNDAVNELLYI